MIKRVLKLCVNPQLGSAMTETAVCLPVLLILLMGMADLGRWMNKLYTLSQITYEAARYGASLAGMEENSNQTKIWDEVSNPQAFQGTATVAAQVKVRVSQLLQRQSIETSTAKLRMSFDHTPSNNYVNLEVNLPFTPVLPFLRSSIGNVKANANAPYLFARTAETPYTR